MGNILDPNERIRACKTTINQFSAERSRVVGYRNSLKRFQSVEGTEHQNFDTGVNQGKKLVNGLKNVKNNTVVKKYYDGTSDALSGVGVTVVSVALGALEVLIVAKLAEYDARIATLDGLIASQYAAIAEAELEIKTAEAAEKAVDTVVDAGKEIYNNTIGRLF